MTFQVNHTVVEDTFAEAFRMWGARLIVTACNEHWVQTAAQEACSYGTSVIGCDAEAGIECTYTCDQTPDGRPGIALLMLAFNAKAVAKAVLNRVGQCLMTCPTTAVYDGLPDANKAEDSARMDVGKSLRFFGDGFQKSKMIGNRRFWRVPVMDGEFVVEESIGATKAIGGGNFLICGEDQNMTLDAAQRAVNAIKPMANVITPFPGGVVRSGSKVGSRYKTMFASTNDPYCPTLRGRTDTRLHTDANCVYEIVINGLDTQSISSAMRAGIEAACSGTGICTISAGNYGGKLGKFHFKLHDVLQGTTAQ